MLSYRGILPKVFFLCGKVGGAQSADGVGVQPADMARLNEDRQQLLDSKSSAPITAAVAAVAAAAASTHILTLGNWLRHRRFNRLWQRSLDLVKT